MVSIENEDSLIWLVGEKDDYFELIISSFHYNENNNKILILSEEEALLSWEDFKDKRLTVVTTYASLTLLERIYDVSKV